MMTKAILAHLCIFLMSINLEKIDTDNRTVLVFVLL